jgi:hypothetical protein
MSKKLVFLRVGQEPVRGPVDARAVVDSVTAGVTDSSAEVAETKDGLFMPVSELSLSLKKARSRALRAMLGVVAVIALVGGGTAGGMAYSRSRPHKLCEATPRLLEGLPSELVIEAYVTRGTPKLDAFVEKLEVLLRQYEAAAPKKVKVRVIEASDEPSRAAAAEAGLVQMLLGDDEEGTGVNVRKGYSGIVLRYAGAKDSIKYLPPENADALEFWITSKIREVHAREDHAGYRLLVASGHGEASLRTANLVASTAGSSPNLQGIMEQTFPFYAFIDADLTKGPPDESAVGLLLTQPSTDLTDAELSRIDQYVMKGHALVVAASAVNVRAGDASMTFTLAGHGLPSSLRPTASRCTRTWWLTLATASP